MRIFRVTNTMLGLSLGLSLLTGCFNPEGLAGIVKSQLGGNNSSASSTSSSSSSAATSGSTSASANANLSLSVPNPLEVATVASITGKSCSEEASLKSASSTTSTNITFKNSSSGKIHIYWLDFNGKRVEYGKSGNQASGGIDAGVSYTQQTYLTHPWLITDDNGNCQGIYFAPTGGGSTVEITKTVASSSGSASGSTSTSTSGTVNDSTGLQSRIECLKGKGKTAEAMTVQAELNLYLAAQKQGGLATILGNAHLTSAQDIAAKAGC